MTQTALADSVSRPPWNDAKITVLAVDDEQAQLERLDNALSPSRRLDVHTVSVATDILSHLDAVDCVVSGDAIGDRDGLELLTDIRKLEPTLPFVLHTRRPLAELEERLLEDEWASYLRKTGSSNSIGPLKRRIYRLVDYRRTTMLAKRALAGVQAASDGLAIVDPDGTVVFANPQYARQFASDCEAVVGCHWSEHYPPEEVRRLEETAIPTAHSGWRWTGTCLGRAVSGERFTARISVVGVADGSLVFALEGAADAVREE